MAGGSKSSSEPTDVTPQAFKDLQPGFADIIGQLMGLENTGVRKPPKPAYRPVGNTSDPLRNIPQYGGQVGPAQMGGNEKALLDRLMGIQSGGQGGAPATPSQGYMQDAIAGKYVGSNPFLDAAIRSAQRPTMQGLEETLSRTLPGRFTQAGQFTQPQGSSAFDRAAAIATRGAADAAGDIATNMSYAGYEGERGRQQEAAMQLPQLTAQEINSTIQNLQAQALPRMIEELGIERGLEQFQNRMNTMLAIMGIASGTTAPVIGQKSSSSTKPNVLPALGAM
jgi:hypothetical protein